MSGLDILEGFVIGVAMATTLFLSWSLFGPELGIILTGFIALGTVLSLTSLHEHEPGLSPPHLRHSQSLPSKPPSAPMKPRVCVTPDSPVLYRRRQKKASRHLGGKPRSLSFDEEL
jgi:hypothetical protein